MKIGSKVKITKFWYDYITLGFGKYDILTPEKISAIKARYAKPGRIIQTKQENEAERIAYLVEFGTDERAWFDVDQLEYFNHRDLELD